MDNIAALGQAEFEKELELKRLGWDYIGQKFDPSDFYGGAIFYVSAVAEIYSRGDESLEFWWISPQNISKVIKDGEEYPGPSDRLIRMLVK